MSKWWVALSPDGTFMGQVYQGHIPTSADFDGRKVGSIIEMVRHGDPVIEIPDPGTGNWMPNDVEAERRAIADVKAQAERDCLAISPLWQQLNDVRKPTPEGQARFDAIDAIRAASNKAEADIKKVNKNG